MEKELGKEVLKLKEEEYQAILRDIATTKIEEDRLFKIRRANQLAEDIEMLKSKNSSDEIKSKNSSDENFFKKALQKIDFRQARNIAELLRNEYQREEGGAILLFVQQSHQKLGEYCMKEFIDVILNMSHDPEKSTLRTINLDTSIYLPGKYAFIIQISKSLDITISEKPEEIDKCLDKIVNDIHEKLNSSLLFRDWVFYVIKSIDRENEKQFIEWFLQFFWNPLIDKDKDKDKNKEKSSLKCKESKLIFALIAESELSIDLSPYVLPAKVYLNNDKMINIPLQDWTEEDITNWLKDNYRLFPCFSNLQESQQIKNEVMEKSKFIYKMSQGKPRDVYSKLKEYFYEQR